MKVAVLITCFNRKEKTKESLSNLFGQRIIKGMLLKVFICDDNSSDGTEEMLRVEFPQVKVVKGDGNRYWGGGMRLAWEAALEEGGFDFFLWLNDDTFLFENALQRLFLDAESLVTPAILTAACKRPGSEEFSYGGWDDTGPVLPNGSLQKVTYINGNLVLIPRLIVDKIGMNSKSYTHYLGDYDYGLRAQKAGFYCFTTTEYLAECEVNEIPYWGNPRLSLKQRWTMAHHVKGLAFSEYIAYQNYHYGFLVGFKTKIGTYLRILFPSFYINLRNSLKKLSNT